MTIGEALREKGIELPIPARYFVTGQAINVLKPIYLRQSESDRDEEEESSLP